MKQKRIVILLLCIFLSLLFIFSINYVSADAAEDVKVAKAFNWLSEQTTNWGTLNTKQNVFALLALQCNSSAFERGNTSLYEKSVYFQGKRCWGENKAMNPSQCLLTETALAKIAADEFDHDTTPVDKWIITQNKTFTDIYWYLQIDVERGTRANCTLIYDNSAEEKIFRIWENKTVSISVASKCFEASSTIPSENFWFKVKPSCYNKDFTVKCWGSSSFYSVSWLYKKTPGSNSYYVSGETKSAQPGYGSKEPDPIDTSLTSYCLANPSGNCNYEGTAWSAYALAKSGKKEEANTYLPYLITMMDSNMQYFPETFLYQLMGTSLYEMKIKTTGPNAQKSQGYWLIEEPSIVYNRNYDTAHAVLALGLDDEASLKAKDYLLSTQSSLGYWDTTGSGYDKIRDTAFILWVFWPDFCNQGTGGDCESQGAEFSCKPDCEAISNEIEVPSLICPGLDVCCKKYGFGDEDCINAQGNCKDECSNIEAELTQSCSGTNKCCRAYADMSCSDANGKFCVTGEMCSGKEVSTYDSFGSVLCCIGECIASQTCTEQDGEICELPNNYCPASKKLTASDTNYCCEQGSCALASTFTCTEIGGILCDSGDVCLDSQNDILSFVNTQDGNCCVDGDCGSGQTCNAIGGEECAFNEECYQNVLVKTIDSEECCTTACLESCVDLGGNVCEADQECKGGNMVESSEYGPDVERCCILGACSNKGGFPWWIIIILVVLGGGAAAYFLYFKKLPKKPKQQKPSMFPFGPAATRPSFPTTPTTIKFPMTKPAAKPTQVSQLFRPKIVMPSVPKPEQKMPSNAPQSIVRKIERPSRTISRSTKPKTRSSSSELERTLSKLKKITKK